MQEITQLDVELAFPDREFVIGLMERMVQAVWRECIDVELAMPFRRMAYEDAMLRYGTDKPDLRFGLEIEDATEITRGSEFKVFAGAQAVRFLRVPRQYLARRARAARRGREGVGRERARVLVWEDGEPRSPIAKFLSEAELEAFGASRLDRALRRRTTPDAVRACSATSALGSATSSGSSTRSGFDWVWIIDFPMFDWSEDEERWQAHTIPSRGLRRAGRSGSTRSLQARESMQYDLVGNGNELGGGSFRIHEADLQERVFRAMRSFRPRSSGRSSASCSMRSRWALRRTAASRSGSTGW